MSRCDEMSFPRAKGSGESQPGLTAGHARTVQGTRAGTNESACKRF